MCTHTDSVGGSICSVGLENAEDLIKDLQRALDKIED